VAEAAEIKIIVATIRIAARAQGYRGQVEAVKQWQLATPAIARAVYQTMECRL
jgi:hypothetical protein